MSPLETTADADGPAEIDAQEAVGVVAAVCATLRNAMEGTERGHAEEALAVDAAKAFADVAGTLSEWAERVLNDRTVAWREGGDVEDGTFLRGLQGLRRDGVVGAGAPGAWRQMLDFLRALVPAETDQLLIGANSFTSGGGAGYLSHSDGEEEDDERRSMGRTRRCSTRTRSSTRRCGPSSRRCERRAR